MENLISGSYMFCKRNIYTFHRLLLRVGQMRLRMDRLTVSARHRCAQELGIIVDTLHNLKVSAIKRPYFASLIIESVHEGTLFFCCCFFDKFMPCCPTQWLQYNQPGQYQNSEITYINYN
ncbi:unnamed protein product [Albugo candida]|uniref:Uncharacterized protein n=1 Tax=Albugo candida TaxID=65357 RepID=A0A024GB07_9STRA|nr:unnamed protein product [Albugo candida]|eukprot:CCI43849.1 unnamed protein product [Albugo candida]